MRHYDSVIRGAKAIQVLTEIKGKMSEENIIKWRNICCVNPHVGCRNCPIGVPPKEGENGWCHDWWEASIKLRLKKRLENIRKYFGDSEL